MRTDGVGHTLLKFDLVRYGSKADLTTPKSDVRSAPESGYVCRTGHVRKVPPADSCTAAKDLSNPRQSGQYPNQTVSLGGTIGGNSYIGEAMSAHAKAIHNYIRAKDENRPHLMSGAFAPDASLKMRVETENISFPPASNGIDAITQVLVRDFALAYENIYTFCLDGAPTDGESEFRCRWLVGMSVKETKSIRVGCGQYEWRFGENKLVQDLTITIKTMLILPSDHCRLVMNWLSHLPYPWCPEDVAAKGMPSISELNEVRQFLAGNDAEPSL